MGSLHSCGPPEDAPVTCTITLYIQTVDTRNAVANRSTTSVRKVRWAPAGTRRDPQGVSPSNASGKSEEGRKAFIMFQIGD